ncbi:lipid A deacylase LpxR family protein [Flavicella sediminum]|uniref:lipid A deacylase LpxR family protein n=1 Tax=Flavicella sediminum TaxID=2585141 RepID=UPI00140AFEA8|nr:lipid A deacylase LpxR family protein [Flavicella sediminum]
MISKKTLFFFILFVLLQKFSAFAQGNFSKEIGIISDNDLYVTTFRDRYYTNGTFLYFKYLGKSTQRKRIHEFQIGQRMYTPNQVYESETGLRDRQYAGYSFLKYSGLSFLKNKAALKMSIEIGAMGPNSLAKEFQNVIHDLYGFQRSEGWADQIANRFGFGIEANYTQPLLIKKRFDLHFTGQVIAGTIFTNSSIELTNRFNLFNKALDPLNNSVAFGSHLTRNSKNSSYRNELFLFFSPSLNYAFYDATIQAKSANPYYTDTYNLVPFTYTLQIGIQYAIKRFSIEYSILKYSKKVKEMHDKTNTYGSIKLAYRFN